MKSLGIPKNSVCVLDKKSGKPFIARRVGKGKDSNHLEFMGHRFTASYDKLHKLYVADGLEDLMLNSGTPEDRLFMADSFKRMEVLIKLYGEMTPEEWFAFLRENWEICDSIAGHREELIEIFNNHRDLWHLAMRPNERHKLDSLPERVKLNRGCSPEPELGLPYGLSWSLSKKVASKFPYLNRYRVDKPTLFQVEVEKSRIIAFKSGRREEEVIIEITTDDKVTSSVPLPTEKVQKEIENLKKAGLNSHLKSQHA